MTAPDNDSRNIPAPGWADALARRILDDQRIAPGAPWLLKTANPAIHSHGLAGLLRALDLVDVFARVWNQPHHAVTGAAQADKHSTRRPAFDIETISEWETAWHADFEKVQYALIIRRNPQDEDAYQLDEAHVLIGRADRQNREILGDCLTLDCGGDDPRHTALLHKLVRDFARAARAITGVGHGADRFERVHAAHNALLAAKSAQVIQNDLYAQRYRGNTQGNTQGNIRQIRPGGRRPAP